MKIKKDIVTPFVATVFLIVAFSGILMFFHLLDDYTNVVHEFLGLAFVIFIVLHVASNWISVKSYFKNQKFIIPSIAVLILAIALVIIGVIKGNLEREILERLTKAPVSNSFKALNIDFNQAKTILEKNKIVINNPEESLEDICIKNHKSPEEVMELIVK